jgi:AcrR family transcriptional regulator
MSQSATISRRTERKAATASRLTTLARRWTAERGLSGFTIEELCENAGVSRRTFFNYFPSKEEAVIGVDETEQAERFAADFLDLGSRGWPTVVDDLIRIAVEHVRETEHSLDEHAEFITAIGREPKLLARFMSVTREREQQIAELIAAREGVPTSDPRARAAVQIVGAVLRGAGDSILDPADGRDFASAITDSLAALREVLTKEDAS